MIKLTKQNLKWWLPPLAILFILFSCAFAIFWFPNTFDEPAGKVVTIPRGASFKAVVDSLHSSGIINSRFLFKTAGRIIGSTKSIKVGKYLFMSGVSNAGILTNLKTGKSRMLLPVVVPEGLRMVNVAKRFEADLGIDAEKFLAICQDPAFIHSQRIEANSLEGYLLPETYKFFWQTEELEIVERLIKEFKEFYVDSLKERQNQLKMSMQEILTLASIVEGESSLDEERPVIAGVYWNRLKKRMRLEADPTVQYALPDGPRRLFHRDLKFNSPYNTYLVYGLPPGPINNPGKKSILATLYPENHQYLYFVATGIGGHRFSKNFIDHQKAIRVFRRARRAAEKDAVKGG